ncbi:MAG: porin family protein [Arcticibacter sp.]
MKKALLTLGIALAAMTTQAQDFRLGITGGLNSTWLLNDNVFSANDGLDVASTFGGRFGLEGIYSFNEKVGMSIGLNFISGHNQKYAGDQTFLDGDLKTKLRYIDIPLMFRLTSGSGSYFELGPQIGILSSAKEDFKSNDGQESWSDVDVKSSLNTTNVAFVFGFGADIDVSENIFITTGLRLGYGFTDVTKDYPTTQDFLNDNPDYVNNDAIYLTSVAAQQEITDNGATHDYKATSRAFAGLHLGVSYKFSK